MSQSDTYSNFWCSFRPCGATYASMFALWKYEWSCKDQCLYLEQTTVVSAASTSVQKNHELNSEENTRPFSASEVVEKNSSTESHIDHLPTSYSTRFWNINICIAAELISEVSWEWSKSSANKLLKFFCRMCLTSTDFKDQLYPLEVCQKILNDVTFDIVSCMNMELRTLSSMANFGKKEQHIFYVQKSSEVIRAQIKLAREHQVFTMPCSWNVDDFWMMRKICKSRTHITDTLFSKEILKCAWEHILNSADPLTAWQDWRGSGIPSFVGTVQVYTDKTTTSLKAILPSHIQCIFCSSTVRERIVDI